MDLAVTDLVTEMVGGAVKALSRLITLVENDSPEVPSIMEMIAPRLGRGYCVGITGAPGVGKSTLTDQLVGAARAKGLTVGIVAADPSSPLHGGAVLGDRIRMEQHFLDKQVFIRSMATRGHYGGLPRSTGNVVKLLDAFGKDLIIVETVGVGQTELAISTVTDTIVLVLSPDSGDTIQFMKAGIIEIADVIVVNKADHGNAEGIVFELKALLRLSAESFRREPAILTTEALNKVGIDELYQELEKCRQIRKAGKDSQRMGNWREP